MGHIVRARRHVCPKEEPRGIQIDTSDIGCCDDFIAIEVNSQARQIEAKHRDAGDAEPWSARRVSDYVDEGALTASNINRPTTSDANAMAGRQVAGCSCFAGVAY